MNFEINFAVTPDAAARQLADSIGHPTTHSRQWQKAFRFLDDCRLTTDAAARFATSADAVASLRKRSDQFDSVRDCLADLYNAICEQPPAPTDATRDHLENIRKDALTICRNFKKALATGTRDNTEGFFWGMHIAALAIRSNAMDAALRNSLKRVAALEKEVRESRKK